MKDATLVVMAAGIGSRFGGGIKQLEAFGPKGEIIMDYAIYDAINAGFNKVVFILRRDIERDFKVIVGDRISKFVHTEYVFQDLDISDYTDKYDASETAGRKKPWGTGQAVLACKDVVNEPFAVINADDFYGSESFVKIYDYLTSLPEGSTGKYCMAGYILGNTLSENGTVKRGLCGTDDAGRLVSIEECTELAASGEDTVSGLGLNGEKIEVSQSTPVSMNLWGFTPDFFDRCGTEFKNFFENEAADDLLSAEFYLPSVVSAMIDDGSCEVAVIPTPEKWIGVTYREDKPFVVEAIKKMVEDGKYPEGVLRGEAMSFAKMARPEESLVYTSASSRAAERRDSGQVLIVIGVIGVVLLIVNISGVVSIPFFKGSGMVKGWILFAAMIVGGILMKKKADSMTGEIEAEDSLYSDIITYLRDNFTADDIMKADDPAAEDEENYLLRTEFIKNSVTEKFGSVDEAFLDDLTENFYKEVFGDD